MKMKNCYLIQTTHQSVLIRLRKKNKVETSVLETKLTVTTTCPCHSKQSFDLKNRQITSYLMFCLRFSIKSSIAADALIDFCQNKLIKKSIG